MNLNSGIIVPMITPLLDDDNLDLEGLQNLIELLMESLLLGGNGGVPGGANIFPELYVNIYDSVKTGNLDEARKLQRKVMQLSEIVYSVNGYGSSNVINGIKCALSHLNLCNDFTAKPMLCASKKKSENIKQYLNNQE